MLHKLVCLPSIPDRILMDIVNLMFFKDLIGKRGLDFRSNKLKWRLNNDIDL